MSDQKNDPFKERTVQKHPSFCTVSFHKITGERSFFGSPIKSTNWIKLCVHPAELHHDRGHDSVMSSHLPMIEVALSQLSSQNS